MTTNISDETREGLTLLDVDEVAELLKLKKEWVYEAVRAGHIPHLRLGRQIRFHPDALREWIKGSMR